MGHIKIVWILILACISQSHGYKPIIFMHGIFSGPEESETIFNWVTKDHPGTMTYTIDMYNDIDSVVDMVTQINDVGQKMMEIMTQHPEGVNLICFSQGGLVCRGVLEQFKHNVHTLISLSSPQAGQFGDTSYVNKVFPAKFPRDEVYKFAYSDIGQEISVSNYWNDPNQQDLYRKFSTFLAVINNDTVNPRSQEFKANFLRLKQIVMIGGPDDGVITPWQSSHFGTYDGQINDVNMTDTKWYKMDTFGLRTLDERKALHTYVIPGVQHVYWYRTESVYRKCILPYLT